jgi:hypothetical protein
MPEWTVDGEQNLTFDDTEILDLRVRLVDGTVNVVPTDGPARLEISKISGPPLIVTQTGRKLTVAYEDLKWKNLMEWLDQRSWRRRAVVTVAVPRAARAQVGVVSGDAMVTGLHGEASLNAVSGTLTMANLSGDVDAHAVSGRITAQAVTGDLKCKTVSGDIIVYEGSDRVRADAVSGTVTVDVAGHRDRTGAKDRTEIEVNTVSGQIAVRLPVPTDAEVDATSTGGSLVNGFEELQVRSGFGPKHLNGRLGNGRGRIKANSISGSITLLKRSPSQVEEPTEGKDL